MSRTKQAQIIRPLRREFPSLPATSLRATIETRIIPRLALLAPVTDSPPLEASRRLEAHELEHWADVASAGDLGGLRSAARQLHARGWANTAVLLDAISPVARLVGHDWAEDRRTWLEVTIAVSTLQQLVCALGGEGQGCAEHRGSILLFAAPGEQHTLSIHVLGEVLRCAGWSVRVEPRLSTEDLVERVAREPIHLVGMTVSGEDRMVFERQDVERVTAASIEPGLVFALGGAVDVKEYGKRIGATVCADAREVLALLDRPRRGLGVGRPTAGSSD